jgi:sulfite exporter TauE/SafE
MNQFIVAFITGLTTGGLSCLAVQGGLLASSLGHQLEKDMLTRSVPSRRRHGKKEIRQKASTNSALPILLFLGSKLVAYTILGFLLGLLGSVLTLTPTLRAILLIAIGIFMVGNALRMLNVHPIFRIFIIEPPRFVTRYIRRTAKNGTETDLATPMFLGALTVLIPCGVTQAMMAVALATGNAIQGAALMFAFILGTSPVFFLVAYLTTALGSRLEGWFMRFVAVVVLVLGLVSINNGLTLVGSPLSAQNLAASLFAPPAYADAAANQPASSTLTLAATNSGYTPRRLKAKAGVPVLLNIVTQNTYSCSRDLVIPALGIEKLLPANGTVPINIPAQPAGTIMRFSCSMGMYTGMIEFTQ